jgi:hypothetical protein
MAEGRGLKSKKPRKCANRGCGKDAVFMAALKPVCSAECAAKIAMKALDKKKATDAKEERKRFRERKAKLNDTVPYWTKKAQVEFNKYIRLRDKKLPCVSCGKPASEDTFLTGSGWDCGHYRSTGACPELRFCELNAAKQCVKCNQFKSGNVVEYRIELARRIGTAQLEWLEGPHEAKRYRVDELKGIHAKYKAKCKELENDTIRD